MAVEKIERLSNFLDNLPITPCSVKPDQKFCTVCRRINEHVYAICQFAELPIKEVEEKPVFKLAVEDELIEIVPSEEMFAPAEELRAKKVPVEMIYATKVPIDASDVQEISKEQVEGETKEEIGEVQEELTPAEEKLELEREVLGPPPEATVEYKPTETKKERKLRLKMEKRAEKERRMEERRRMKEAKREKKRWLKEEKRRLKEEAKLKKKGILQAQVVEEKAEEEKDVRAKIADLPTEEALEAEQKEEVTSSAEEMVEEEFDLKSLKEEVPKEGEEEMAREEKSVDDWEKFQAEVLKKLKEMKKEYEE